VTIFLGTGFNFSLSFGYRYGLLLAFQEVADPETTLNIPVRHFSMQMIKNLSGMLKLGMRRILFLPEIRPAGYQANPKAGYRISGRISG
jgi:hypothetical protein